jgi:CheY-like chemotaxis protein
MAEQLFLTGKRVLVADDEPFSRRIISSMVERLGCTAITVVGDGDAAMEALQGPKPYHVAILDFRMPNRNGLEILKEIRIGASRVPRDQRVMMLTASGDYGLLGAAMALDADAFVVKPITQQQMAERLLGVFNQWGGEFKAPVKYEQIDIEEVSRRLNGTLPAAPKEPAPGRPRRGTSITLEDTRPGMVLSEDVCGPQNQLVLASGVRLSQRLISRLVEVKDVLAIGEIWVEDEAAECEAPQSP